MRKLVFYSFVLMFCVALPLRLSATIYGRITGVVHDPQHRPVQDVSVVLKATTSDYTQTAQTNSDGEFTFQAVPIGDYSVTVSKSGFASRNRYGDLDHCGLLGRGNRKHRLGYTHQPG
jgi:hypothetical protein